MTNQKIFFSYARADGSEFALRLALDLKNKGFDAWIDQEDIRAGLEWDREIEKALESCDCVLFLETEQSVVSHNVLDEVYYALEKNKKVIPLVFVDAKTPFRLNRLQHIDFTKNYDAGLAHLVNELQGIGTPLPYPRGERAHPASMHKPLKKNYGKLGIVALVALLIIFAIVFITQKKSAVPAENTEAIAAGDTTTNEAGVPGTAVTDMKAEEDSKSEAITSPVENKRTKKTSAGAPHANAKSAESTPAKKETGNLNELVAGDWRLTDVEPKASSHRGYLKIEALAENKATIKSYMQFYYPESKASSYLTVFNAFAGCTSCAVNKEIKLVVEDIAVGSRTIKKLQEDQADGGKAGDIILDANSNKSIRGTVTLQFIDNDNAIMKVRQPQTIALAYEFMLEPFEYTFRFKKNE